MQDIIKSLGEEFYTFHILTDRPAVFLADWECESVRHDHQDKFLYFKKSKIMDAYERLLALSQSGLQYVMIDDVCDLTFIDAASYAKKVREL